MTNLIRVFVAFAVVAALAFTAAAPGVAAEADWRYRRSYSLGPGKHVADLGEIDGAPHMAIQSPGAGGLAEIRLITLSSGGYLLRNRITSPAHTGDWGHLLAEVPDADGDGRTDLATFGGSYRFYVMSSDQPVGATLTGEQAKVYSYDFADEPRGFVSLPELDSYVVGEWGRGATKRLASTGAVVQTVTDAFVSASIGDFTEDGVDDYLMRDGNLLHVISGAEMASGTAASLAVMTFSDPETPELGYMEDNNNIATVVGDINSDGVPDLAVGSRLYKIDVLGGNYGRVVVFDGSTGAVIYRIEPDQTHSNGVYFGNNVTAPADLDGDGVTDLVVGARGYARPGNTYGDGAIIAFSGVDGTELWRAYGNNNESMTDYELEVISDLNDDGIPDLAAAGADASVWVSCDAASESGCDSDASVPALDDDGVPDAIEDAGPNGGDGNRDGIPDKEQDNVATMRDSADVGWVTMTSTGTTRLLGVTAFAPPLGAPDEAAFPIGMFGFQVNGLQAGGAVIVTLTIHSATEVLSHWKYGPEPGDSTYHWYEFLFDGTTGATFSGNTITLHFIDGDRGDQDLSANGVVVDPSAPAIDSYKGIFSDDDGSVFESDIEWIAARGITKGCNPPANTTYCPDNYVTRGQMAAFLDRALGWPSTPIDFFIDDEESIFQANINRMAASGVTRGCNPPENDRFCPDSKVTRAQMASFLVRAMGYADNGGGDLFIDDDGLIFENDIDRLGTAGVTKGCNPSDGNTKYCPNSYVTRGQMAAFLHRALG